MSYSPLTAEEKKAIAELRKLAKKWPRSLWIFAAAGSCCVMKKGADGKMQFLKNCAVDPDYHVDTIRELPIDGGDW